MIRKGSFILLLFVQTIAFGQSSVQFHNMTTFSSDSLNSHYSIIFLTADWCGYCHASKKLLRKSRKIQRAMRDDIQFFEFPEKEDAPIQFRGKTYFFKPYGNSVGRHEFLDHVLNDPESLTFPSFIILDPKKEIIGTVQGFIKESEWVEILENLVN